MGTSKSSSFSEYQQQLATMAKALAHPARIAIIQYLLEKQTCHCGGLVEELPLSQATVSQHLKELKTIGLLKGEVEGARICYCINEKVWEEYKHLFSAFFSVNPLNNKCC